MEKKRIYAMRKRRESQNATRQRIVEATMRLHEEIGPRATTISAIAERAGVQRLTVYRHFPDETAVFQACTAHWLSLNPPPDPARWESIPNGLERTRAALSAFYDYYRKTQRMWTVSYRDVADVPALQAPMAEVQAFLKSIGDDLASHFKRESHRAALNATIHHALSFPTWHSLNELGLSQPQKLDTVLRWIGAV